ncbi:TolC family outer membrane protein [Nitrincola iocasae]|uniref:TolC family outer membrane protein n=1 Tax=Nitrincola iocasae TaxID=2614693 RepID=A0A5J6LEP6_9GAMM|nr:TolC family outer membrane protein [Nitrincola iocasae]QEW06796.1 TolC family outer membrane protein [Nitrincola iocasae]
MLMFRRVPNPQSRVWRLSRLLLVAAVSMAIGGTAAATEPLPSDQQVSIQEDYHRLTLSARAGEMAGAYLQENGQRLFITLTDGANLEEWRLTGERLVQQYSLYHASSLQTLGERSYLIIDLARPVYLVDETLSLSVVGLVNWEMVFANLDDTIVSAELLDSIHAESRGGLIELTFTGHHDLITELMFEQDPDQLVIELPGVDPRHYLRQANLQMPALLGLPEVQGTPNGHSRLVFTTQGPMDLVDAHTSIDPVTNRSRIHLLLVPDGAVSERSLLNAEQLNRFELTPEAGAGLNLIIGKLAESRVNSYFLEAPGRLMVDFPGVSPETVEQAVFAFAPDPDYVKRIRYGETRLGSARIELTLHEGYAEQLSRQTVAHRDNYEFGTLVSLPEASRVLSESDYPDDLQGIAYFERDTLRHLPRFDFSVQPSLTIGSVTLSGAEYRDGSNLTALGQGQRFSLMTALDEALLRDPTYHAARAEFRAIQELIPQARSEYLPQVSFSYQFSAKNQNVISSGSIPEEQTSLAEQSASLTLTQPIYRPGSLIGLTQAEKAVQQAELALLAAEQSLIMRIAEAYLNVLSAQDSLEVAKAEHEAIATQFRQTEISFRSGLASRSDLSEAQSLTALTRARMIEAQNRLDDAQLAVKEIIGSEVESLHSFSADFRAAPPFPAQVEPWISAALDQNLSLQSRRMAEQIAGNQIRRERAGHLPTVDLFASTGFQDADKTLYSNSRQTVNNYEVGVRVNVPIFSGGRTSSLVREATARYEQTGYEVEQEHRLTERTVRSAFNGVTSSAEMLAALREGVLAQEVRLATRMRGFQAGLESTVAVLDAYQSYYAARRDFLQSRYDYLMNRLVLKQSVGTLSRQDLAELDRLLERH